MIGTLVYMKWDCINPSRQRFWVQNLNILAILKNPLLLFWLNRNLDYQLHATSFKKSYKIEIQFATSFHHLIVSFVSSHLFGEFAWRVFCFYRRMCFKLIGPPGQHITRHIFFLDLASLPKLSNNETKNAFDAYFRLFKIPSNSLRIHLWNYSKNPLKKI